jgi:hypothetical protein
MCQFHNNKKLAPDIIYSKNGLGQSHAGGFLKFYGQETKRGSKPNNYLVILNFLVHSTVVDRTGKAMVRNGINNLVPP